MKTSNDWHIETKTLDEVEPGKNGWFYVTTNSITCGIQNPLGLPLPNSGDAATFCYEAKGGWGGRTTGFYCNGLEYFYVTREELKQEDDKWLANYEKRKQNEYYENIGKWLDRKKKLIPALQARLDRFESEKGVEDFWREDGGYELFVLEQAQILYFHVLSQFSDPVAWIDNWRSLPYNEQMKVPGLSDGHSGNTFGGMVGIARALLEGKDV